MTRARRAFTLIELLVVVALIGLLMSILLPSLQGAREQAKRAYCLANLRSIIQASIAYAGDEPKDLVIPIHSSMVTFASSQDYWLRRTAMWFAFGGRSAPKPFLTTNGPRMLDDSGTFAAATRPLNRYIFTSIGAADAREMKLFRCPSDAGYPAHPDIDDSPAENAERACYDTLGNSYRASLFGVFPLATEAYDGAFAVGPWGHTLGSIPEPARVPVYGEPRFFNMIGLDNGDANPDAVIALGWHKQWMQENVAYCDGSARATRATGHQSVEREVAETRMAVGPNWDLISRGPSWRFDLWPTPGARVWAYDPANQLWNPGYTAHPEERWRYWPYLGAQDNLRPGL